MAEAVCFRWLNRRDCRPAGLSVPYLAPDRARSSGKVFCAVAIHGRRRPAGRLGPQWPGFWLSAACYRPYTGRTQGQEARRCNTHRADAQVVVRATDFLHPTSSGRTPLVIRRRRQTAAADASVLAVSSSAIAAETSTLEVRKRRAAGSSPSRRCGPKPEAEAHRRPMRSSVRPGCPGSLADFVEEYDALLLRGRVMGQRPDIAIPDVARRGSDPVPFGVFVHVEPDERRPASLQRRRAEPPACRGFR